MLQGRDEMHCGQKSDSCLLSNNVCASLLPITKSLDYLERQLVRLMLAVKFSITCYESQCPDYYFKLPIHQFILLFLGWLCDGTATRQDYYWMVLEQIQSRVKRWLLPKSKTFILSLLIFSSQMSSYECSMTHQKTPTKPSNKYLFTVGV